MKTAARMIEIASRHPRESLEDVIGLAAICVLVFAGFAVTAMA